MGNNLTGQTIMTDKRVEAVANWLHREYVYCGMALPYLDDEPQDRQRCFRQQATALLALLEPVREALRKHGFCNTGPRNDQACPLCTSEVALSKIMGSTPSAPKDT